MKFVAITGSFASGKSFVSRYLEKVGYKLFSCDNYVRKLYLDLNIQKEIISLLGLLVFDKKEIIRIIYNDAIKRKKLENYIHPLVREGMKEFKEQYSSEKILFVEIPLLFENTATKIVQGFNNYFDYSICVYCSEENRLIRAKKRENFNLEIYNKIGAIQLPSQKKIEKADFKINTDLSFEDTKKQVDSIIEKLK